jgi:membrane-associated protein
MKMKKLFLLVVLMVTGCMLFAQSEIRMRVINQYESSVGQFSLITGESTKEYVADKQGYVLLPLDSMMQVKITAPIHDTISFSYAGLDTAKTVVLNKSFDWKDLLNPMFYIVMGGLWIILLIVFAETGLFAGFFLPGDSLLFVAGIYSTNLINELFKSVGLNWQRNEWFDLLLLVAMISFAGIIGNTVGYWFGRKIGPTMFRWKDNFFFKKHYLEQAHEFYDKHGGGAIVFARFLPIVRTFAPIIAGIVGMDKKKFAFYNIVGCIAWVVSMIFAGHFLQKWVQSQFGFDLKDHLEAIIIVIVLVTTAPVLIKLITGRKKKSEM